VETDPAIVAALIARNEASVEVMQHEIRMKSGGALLEFIRTDVLELKRLLFDPLSHQALMTGMDATWWLNEHIDEWLGEKNAADALTQSAPGNITSEMGLALMDVADVIRPHDAVVALLERGVDNGFLAALEALSGGPESRDAIQAYLDRYGMRCVGEIDITRPRWSERPSTLVPVLLGNIKSFEPGEGQRRFEHGRLESLAKEADVLRRLLVLPDGGDKADETKRMIDRVRTFAGYREFPKYGIVRRTFIYKQALLGEAYRLVSEGVLRDAEDIFWLTFQELEEVVRTSHVDHELIARRRDSFATYAALTPPRVITSDGEAVIGSYGRRDVPVGALAGLPVSSGTIEGRARVILDIAQAGDIEPSDVLVTAYTDPSWSPLFVLIAAMVTEVGGQMTHGAVIAREYGLPAVVGVEHATQLIRDGQRIRVNGTDGYVEILS
jgi:pyruvate,water dikinase